MRVLITGGGGFLAGHLSAYLLTIAGIEICALKRADCDLSRDKGRLLALLHKFQPDRVIHLAGRISGSESDLDRDNRLASVNLLEAVRQETPEARVVLGSSAAVYGEGGTGTAPVKESQTPNPRSAYAEANTLPSSKLAPMLRPASGTQSPA